MNKSGLKTLYEKGIFISNEARAKTNTFNKKKNLIESKKIIILLATNSKMYFKDAINANETGDTVFELEYLRLALDSLFLLQNTFKSVGVAYNPIIEIYPFVVECLYTVMSKNIVCSDTKGIFIPTPDIVEIEKFILSLFNKNKGDK